MDRPVTRALLMIGIAVVVINGVVLFLMYGADTHAIGPLRSDDVSPVALVPLLGFGMSLFGLWRMWRVWRGD